MSLMESLRSGTDSTPMQIILGLVVVSFIALYGQPSGTQTGVFVTVNGEPVLDTEARLVMRNLERRLGHLATDDERARVREQARQQLITYYAEQQRATELGLVVSLREVLALEADDPAFKVNGVFEPSRVDQVMKEQRSSRGTYEDGLRKQLLVSKLEDAIALGVTLPEPVMRDMWLRTMTKVNLSAVRVRPAAFFDTMTVSDEAVQALLTERPEAVQARYDQDKARKYDVPEQLRLSVIRLALGDDPAAADARMASVTERLRAGEDFTTLAKELSEDPTATRGGSMVAMSVDTLPPELIASVRDPAGALLPAGQVGAVVRSENDLRVYHVDEHIPAVHQELDAVRDAIARRLVVEEGAPAAAIEYAQTLLDAWKVSGTAPADMIAAQGLELTETGPIGLGQNGAFAPPPELLAAASSAPEGGVLGEVYEAGGVYWVAQLQERTGADFTAYEADQDRVRSSVLDMRRQSMLAAWRDELVASAKVQ